MKRLWTLAILVLSIGPAPLRAGCGDYVAIEAIEIEAVSHANVEQLGKFLPRRKPESRWQELFSTSRSVGGGGLFGHYQSQIVAAAIWKRAAEGGVELVEFHAPIPAENFQGSVPLWLLTHIRHAVGRATPLRIVIPKMDRPRAKLLKQLGFIKGASSPNYFAMPGRVEGRVYELRGALPSAIPMVKGSPVATSASVVKGAPPENSVANSHLPYRPILVTDGSSSDVAKFWNQALPKREAEIVRRLASDTSNLTFVIKQHREGILGILICTPDPVRRLGEIRYFHVPSSLRMIEVGLSLLQGVARHLKAKEYALVRIDGSPLDDEIDYILNRFGFQPDDLERYHFSLSRIRLDDPP